MKYELVVLGSGQGGIVIPFKHFHDLWNFYRSHPGDYNFLVDGKLTNIKDYVLDNMLIPKYRFK